MSRNKLIQFLECNEPVFEYKNVEYGICNLGDKYCFGESNTDTKDEVFDSVEELVDELKLGDMLFKDIAEEVLKDYIYD